MTDEQIVRALARLQARGEPGAAQARAFVVGDWLPRWEWAIIHAALLKVGGDATHGGITRYPQEQDCQMLLEALRGLA